MARKTLLTLLGLVFLTPGVAASEFDYASYTFRNAMLTLELYENLDSAERLRLGQEIDANKDGMVAGPEVEAFEAKFNATYAPKPECFEGFGFVAWNGQPPTSVAASRVEVNWAEGPVDQETEVSRADVVVLGFAFGPDAQAGEVLLRPGNHEELARAYECATGATASWMLGAGKTPSMASLWAAGDIWFDVDTVRPARVKNLFINVLTYDGHRFASSSTDEETTSIFYQSQVSFRLVTQVPEGSWAEWVAFTLGMLGGGALLVGLLVGLTEAGRFKIGMALAAIPLFARVEKDEVLANERRGRLYDFIRAHPGASFSDLRRSFDLAHGTLMHHLRVLEAQEFIKPVRDRFRTRFVIRGPRVEIETYLTRTQRTVLDAVELNPGIAPRHLALVLGLPVENLYYHARKLESAGRIRIAKNGKTLQYFALGPSPPGAVTHQAAPA